MTTGYTDTNGRRAAGPRTPPRFRGLCLFAALWAPAAAGARLGRPPSLAGAPAGYPGGDHPEIAAVLHYVFMYISAETALVVAAAMLGWAFAAGVEECDALGARRHRRAAVALALAVPLTWPLGVGTAPAGLLAACVILWPTCLSPERATGQLVLVCAIAAVAGPAFNIVEHYGALLTQARQFGDAAGDPAAWTSPAWQTSQPWAAEAQRAQTTGSWSGWWSLQTTLGFTKASSYRVYTAGMLACTGLLLGLRMPARTTPTASEALAGLRRQKLVLLAGAASGTAAVLLGVLNDWQGLGPRIAEALGVVTAVLGAHLILETLRLDDALYQSKTLRAIPDDPSIRGEDAAAPEAPARTAAGPARPGADDEADAARKPLPRLAGALAAYAAGAAAVHLAPWTSPTPIGAALYGQMDGAGAAAGTAVAALGACAAWHAAAGLRRLRRISLEAEPHGVRSGAA